MRLLEEARLLVREGDRLTLSHEALLSHWRRLKLWVDEESEGRLLLEDFERVAGLWAEKHDDELLYRRRRVLLVGEVLRRQGKTLGGPAELFYRASRAAARRSRIALVTLVLAACAGAVWVREGYADREARGQKAEHRAAEERLEREKEHAKGESEREHAEREHAEREKEHAQRMAAEATLAMLQQQSPESPDAGSPLGPKAIDPGVLREIEAYVLERLRQNEPMPPSLERLLTEANAAAPAPPIVPPVHTDAPPKPLPPPPMARGAAYSALATAKASAARCGKDDGPRGAGQVALVLDPSGKVSSVAMDTPVRRVGRGAVRGPGLPPGGGAAASTGGRSRWCGRSWCGEPRRLARRQPAAAHRLRPDRHRRPRRQPRPAPLHALSGRGLCHLQRRRHLAPDLGIRQGTMRRQLWVTSIRAGAAAGDPSSVPYWLPGQDSTSDNAAARWAPTACRANAASCQVSRRRRRPK